MILITFDIVTGIAKLAQTTTIKQGCDVPVQVIFSATPGDMGGIQVGLGTDAAAPVLLAFTDTFTQENDTTWTGVLDSTDSRLATFMTGKGPTAVNLELKVLLDGEHQIAPNVSITVQPAIIPGAPTSDEGPHYYTETEVDTLLAAKAALTVAGKYRIKGDGSFQLWNATQGKWHTLSVSGAPGAEVPVFGAGES